MPKINPEIKAQWLAALRSGQYHQGRGRLRKATPMCFQHCCLGVLAETIKQDGVYGMDDHAIEKCAMPTKQMRDKVGILPADAWELPREIVLKHATESQKATISELSKDWVRLTELNDAEDPFTFEQLANIIEEAF